jgi:hypothetical protein
MRCLRKLTPFLETVNPNRMVNTSVGVWDVSLAGRAVRDTQISNYNLNSLPATFTTGVVSGHAVSACSDGSNNRNDQTVVFLASGDATTGYAFSMAFAPGAIIGSRAGATPYSIGISNNDNAYHTYG